MTDETTKNTEPKEEEKEIREGVIDRLSELLQQNRDIEQTAVRFEVHLNALDQTIVDMERLEEVPEEAPYKDISESFDAYHTMLQLIHEQLNTAKTDLDGVQSKIQGTFNGLLELFGMDYEDLRDAPKTKGE